MSLITDCVFMNRLSPKLDRCKRKSQYMWNFRCPICGDSKTNKTKKRGYVYRKGDGLLFHCHNGCGTRMFGNFLRSVDASLYQNYVLEAFGDKDKGQVPVYVKPAVKQVDSNPQINLLKIADLPENHFAKVFLLDRKIPREWLSKLYFSKDFGAFINELLPNYETKSYSIINEPRIIIPIYDEQKKLIGLQGRALLKSQAKYITIRTQDEAPKVFGLDRLDKAKRVYVVEGPLDSIFLDNSVATMDSSLDKVASMFNVATYVVDNEPDNKEIRRVMRRIIALGLDIFIWPSYMKFKDINDAIKAGYTSSQLMDIIDSNTFNGLRAQLEMQQWEKGK